MTSPLETFLGGMETKVDLFDRRLERDPLKPSLVEWKLSITSSFESAILILETFLGGMET